SQPSSPRNVGEADTGREARCVGGDGNTRAEASKSGVGPLLASLAVILLILFSLAEGEAVRIGIIRIIEATGEVRCVQYTSSCVARHVPKRQNGAKAIHRQSVISSDREAAASFDEVGLSVAVRAASQPSSPRNVGEADTGREARCVGGDGNTRAEASKSGVGPLLAS